MLSQMLSQMQCNLATILFDVLLNMEAAKDTNILLTLLNAGIAHRMSVPVLNTIQVQAPVKTVS